MNNTPFTGRHWTLRLEENGIAWLELNNADGGANVLSGAIVLELDQVLGVVEDHAPKGLILRSTKANGFIAGADVKEFTTFRDEEEALAAIRRVQPVLDRLENLPCPTLAMIHGFCLGGGLELALACRYRLAADEPDTRLGLPEVKLGIHPGFGGTVRLPPLVGDLDALAMMLTGRTLNARAALKLGLVDSVAPMRQLERAARALLANPPRPHRAGFWKRLPSLWPLRPLVASFLASKTEPHAPARHYPAPYSMLEVWRYHARNRERMLDAEAASVSRLITGSAANNLIRMFMLRDQLKGLGKRSPRPQRVHVIGAGVMGGDIAAWCAYNGLTVTLQDSREESIGRALFRAGKMFRKLLRNPLLERDALDRLIPDPDGAGIPKADVVIEAIFENLEAKRQVFQSVEPRLKETALLATNTSSIPLEEIASVLERPKRFLGLHFFNPVAKMPLLEVVMGQQTGDAARQAAFGFADAVNRLPLPVMSSPGFLINRILMPYLLEAVIMVTEGVDPHEVDRAAVEFGMPMGPIALADTVGLDICQSVASILAEHLHRQTPPLLLSLTGNGFLGKKSGRGFYRYERDRIVGTEVSGKDKAPIDAGDRLFLAMANEAMACLREGVVEDPDLLDAGVVFGTGFAPFLGGPAKAIAQRGFDTTLLRLKEMAGRHGDRFTPDPGWDLPEWRRALQRLETSHETTNSGHDPALAGENAVRALSGEGTGISG